MAPSFHGVPVGRSGISTVRGLIHSPSPGLSAGLGELDLTVHETQKPVRSLVIPGVMNTSGVAVISTALVTAVLS